uniref:restriction endonuclease subunit S n=1 Tax=Chryseobacterium indologenes TaxID=253 RepID=UPI000764BF78
MKEAKLIDFIEEISMGPFGSNIKVDNFKSSGVPVLNGSNLTSHKLVEDNFNYITEKKADSLGKANAKRGDIVITHRGTLGQVSFIPKNSKFERYVISQSQFRVRFNEKIDAAYFSYLMKSEYGQGKLLSFKNHVGVPALAQATTNFKNLEMFIHDISDQKKIASILSTLDDKIELNSSINAELEQMAKTLYDYWFVQFDFPNEDGKPYKSSGGKMVYNEVLKREIPESWEVEKIGSVLKTHLGGTPSTKNENYWNGNIPWMNSGEVANFPLIRTEQKITKDAIKNSSTKLLQKGSVLLSITRHLRVNILGIDACINQSIAG